MIRPYKKSDLKKVFDIYYNPGVHPFMFFTKLPISKFEKEWDNALKQKPIFILEDQNEIKGFIGLQFGEGMQSHIAFIRTFAVKPNEQGKGYGRKLIEFIMKKAETDGAEKLQIEVEADNERAIPFYKKLGFEEEGRMKNYTKRKSGYVDDLVMGKMIK